MRAAVGSLAIVVMMTTWTACVGDDPIGSGGAAMGDRLGACFSDGKCKEGLECRLPERICLTPGEPVPDGGTNGGDSGGLGDGGGNVDGSTNADSSIEGGGGDGGGCGIPAVPGGTYCGPNLPSCSTGCCIATNGDPVCSNGPTCPGTGAARFACDNETDCVTSGGACCLNVDANGTTPAPDTCSAALRGLESVCVAGGCVAPQRRLCADTSECINGGTCVGTEIVVFGRTIIRGVCVP